MSKVYLGKIDVSKIDKKKLFKGEKGIWMDVVVWLNDEPDKYGNSMSIQQKVEKDDEKIYLGNCKEYQKEAPRPITEEEEDDLPF